MIENKDRSYYIGASDVGYVLGNWETNTFAKWWMEKLGFGGKHFDNKYTSAGTHYEHRILESLNVQGMSFDKQIILENLRLRVNLDGNTDITNYECKTYKLENGFKMPKKYIQQVQVQMFASGLRASRIVSYGLSEEDYLNYFNPIDPERRAEHPVEYDRRWIEDEFLPRQMYLAECLKKGVFPI